MDNQHLKKELSKIEIPMELHEWSKMGIRNAKNEMGGKLKRIAKKRLAIAVISACLMLPTGAFAYQTLLADDLYGSFDQLKNHIVNATMESYLLFNAKLDQAKGDLEKEEFEQFKTLLSVFTNAKLEYGDKNGNIDYAQVPAEKLEEITVAMYEVQPYFDKLNGLPSSKEVLTAEEYEQYIQALMVYETTMAQLGISGAPDVASIPSELQDEFVKAQEYLIFVNDKQMEN
ncbi:DUF3600 domain-containing protein [Ureibacillus sinduriensis]|uniref:ECF-type sigma factor negative effector n=1 Tax=Ureibacillus sinduriensis BLB-1 = JCM 15800 TaxID=1384057 RepID=A0A0A3IJ74_9BACL|nr:DUF3600 domain-containing protein [Ureibacillus sinduriensis]KGR74922.1 ECF-type sigma factor negative effector [Ureibacillus sinduriensis BLB-1 = JCM 15800]